jgi:hypothetical protein
MSYTKRQLIDQAFDELGLSPFDIQPDQYTKALRRLDAMIANWNAIGIRLGYPLPTSPGNSDLDQQSNVSHFAIEAICANLAIRVAPSIGKTPSKATEDIALESYNNLANQKVNTILERNFPNTLPTGAGSKGWRNNYNIVRPENAHQISVGDDSNLEL